MKKILLILALVVSYATSAQTCTDPNACNYDPTATVNWPQFCEYTPEPEYFDCDGNIPILDTHPCYPACDCNGTYYDYDFDGDCDGVDSALPTSPISWASSSYVTGTPCDTIDLIISVDISGSIENNNTYSAVAALLDYLYPWIVDGHIRIGFTSWRSYDIIDLGMASHLFDINDNFTGELYWRMLRNIAKFLIDGQSGYLYNPNSVGQNPSNPEPGIVAAYANLANQYSFKSTTKKNVLLVSDAEWTGWPTSAGSNPTLVQSIKDLANSIESGTYDGQFGDIDERPYSGYYTLSNIPANIIGLYCNADDQNFPYADYIPNMIDLVGNEETFYSENSNFTSDFVEYFATSGIEDSFCNEITYDCNSNVFHQSYSYPVTQIGDRCWFAEDLRYDVLTSTTDPELWTSGNETPMQTYEPTLSSDVYNYNWYAVNQLDLCPSGWHVSDNSDWNNLEATLFGAKPHKLTKQSRTEFYNLDVLISNQFLTVPFTVGLRENEEGLWRESETSIYWWTAEEYTRKPLEFNRQKAAWARGINGSSYVISRALWSTSNNKNNALRVRCVKDIN